jgi:hypothetical protein
MSPIPKNAFLKTAAPKNVIIALKNTSAVLSVLSYLGEHSDQGCQMVCFQTKNPYLGKFWRVLLENFWYIL